MTSADILYRPSTDADVPGIHAIYARSVEKEFASWEWTPPDVEEMRRRREAVQAKGFPYLVAEADGAVAGYAYASIYRPRRGYDWTIENSVYVAEGFQRRGIARELMRRVIDICTAQGYRQMVAVIGDSANVASIALHSSLGFIHRGTLPSLGWKQGQWLDSVMMQRELGDGDKSEAGEIE